MNKANDVATASHRPRWTLLPPPAGGFSFQSGVAREQLRGPGLTNQRSAPTSASVMTRPTPRKASRRRGRPSRRLAAAPSRTGPQNPGEDDNRVDGAVAGVGAIVGLDPSSVRPISCTDYGAKDRLNYVEGTVHGVDSRLAA
jgi:hypothetical protein